MDILSNLGFGFGVAFGPLNLFYCFVGVLLGTFIGVLPGVGPLVTLSVLLPLTYGLPPEAALIMLAGIYYGAQYGGSTTSILLNLPGETSSVVTCIDGYQMARQGRAGPALAIAALGSFFAGCVGTVLIALVGPPLTSLALEFGAREYFALIVLALALTSTLVGGSIVKGLASVLIGILIGIVGLDVNSGAWRFTFGLMELADGIDFVVVAMGIFAFAEIASNLNDTSGRPLVPARIQGLMPTLADLRASALPILRGTAVGSFLGVLPGVGVSSSSFAAYMMERRVSRHPERFGQGAIEGVAGPEAANNASAQTHFIPMLTLGIPGSASMAIMLGALMMQGIVPGPQVMTTHPALFWGLIASMWIGNLMLVVLNLPLVGLWVRLLKIPYNMLFPGILVFSCIGLYSLNLSSTDVFLAALFGLVGFVLIKLAFEPAPLILGFVLGPMLEEYFRRSLLLSRGDPTTFFTHPLSASLLGLAALVVALSLLPALKRTKAQIPQEPN